MVDIAAFDGCCDLMEFIAKMREGSNGKPIGFKVAARAIYWRQLSIEGGVALCVA